MATGRMIVNAICADRRVNELSDDTARLAYTWLITFADREGRTYGDPALVRAMLFPRRDDISIERMRVIIQELATAGLIQWYQADGDEYIYFPTFLKNQPGLRQEREAPSRIPEPPAPGSETPPPPGKKPAAKGRSKAGVKPPPPETPTLYEIAAAIAEVCAMDIKLNKGRLLKEAQSWQPEQVARIRADYGPGGAWYLVDWRGQKKQPPKPENIRETWGLLGKIQQANGTDDAAKAGGFEVL